MTVRPTAVAGRTRGAGGEGCAGGAGRVVRALGAGLAVVALVGCGVEVPDDVAERAAETAPTTEGPPATTEGPTSDDELEQTLLDNGYSVEEATCGAAALREELDDDELDEVVGADDVLAIDPDTAEDFAEAIGGCLEDGSAGRRPGGPPGGRPGGSGGP